VFLSLYLITAGLTAFSMTSHFSEPAVIYRGESEGQAKENINFFTQTTNLLEVLNLGIIIFKLKRSNEFEGYENDICYMSKSFQDILA
jgi:hypothetical protein